MMNCAKQTYSDKASILLIFACFMTLTARSQGLNRENATLYGGLISVPISTKDFVDFHISDWENFGLGSREGRVLAALSKNRPDRSGGITFGATYSVDESWNALVELNFTFGKVGMVQILFGGEYYWINKKIFKLGITSKVGYNTATVDLGEIEILPGKTPPVILDEGTFYAGDELEAQFSSIPVQFGITPKFTINQKIGIYTHAYIGFSIGTNSIIKTKPSLFDADGVEIRFTSAGVVAADGTSAQADILPRVRNTGLGIAFGLTYKLQ